MNPISGILKFLSEVRSELYKVTWPTWQQTIRLSAIVIVVSLLIGLFAGGLDYTFTSLLNYLLQPSN